MIVYMNIGDENDYYYFEEGDKYISFVLDLDNYNLKIKHPSPSSDIIAKHIQTLDKAFDENLRYY